MEDCHGNLLLHQSYRASCRSYNLLILVALTRTCSRKRWRNGPFLWWSIFYPGTLSLPRPISSFSYFLDTCRSSLISSVHVFWQKNDINSALIFTEFVSRFPWSLWADGTIYTRFRRYFLQCKCAMYHQLQANGRNSRRTDVPWRPWQVGKDVFDRRRVMLLSLRKVLNHDFLEGFPQNIRMANLACIGL